MRLAKSLVSDSFRYVQRIHSYVHWNLRGVRITMDCFIDVNANLAPTCAFYRRCQITRSATVNYFTYATNTIVENAYIGKFCSIATGCVIGPNEHPTNLISTHPLTYDAAAFNSQIEQARIGNDVWLGANVVILAGVEIPDGCIVASGSVVTKSVDEPFAIIGGVPGRVLKSRDPNWEFINAISATDNPYELRMIAADLRIRNS